MGEPTSKWVRMRYVDSFTLNPGVAGIAFHVFRANSIFDPDLTGGGHQPMNHDQLTVAYDHYTVYGSKITATFIKPAATAIIPGTFGIFVDDDAIPTYTSGERIIESNQRNSRWSTTTGIEGNDKTVSTGVGMKKFFGVATLESTSFRSQVGANPGDGVNFTLWYSNIAGNDPAPGVFLIQIEYLALLTELTHVAQS